jgi:sugar/nucleoside kinase (ribokinase family)
MEPSFDVYLHGMTVLTTACRFDGPLPDPDGYRELLEIHRFVGGEAGMGALLLSRLGLKVRLEGCHLGRRTREAVLETCRDRDIDATALHQDASFEGWEDVVLVHEGHRTVFGRFGTLLFDGSRRWSHPDKGAIESCRVAGLDPFFGEASESAARLCTAAGKPYVTLDCPPEGPLHRDSAATVVSREYVRREHPNADPGRLMERYLEASRGLVVFTAGSGDILYARHGGTIHRFKPYTVEVRSTLGAGDAFRAGVLYGLMQSWKDPDVVRFAAALAACACTRFPLAQDPPSLEQVLVMMESRPAGQ